MINEKDVVTMKIPFPNIDDALAKIAHMYICIKKGDNKEFVKCQTMKPHHLKRNSIPRIRVIEESDITRNPFNNKSIIDCDKKFLIDGVTIPTDLRSTSRPDVCEDLFRSIVSTLSHANLKGHILTKEEVSYINSKIGVK